MDTIQIVAAESDWWTPPTAQPRSVSIPAETISDNLHCTHYDFIIDYKVHLCRLKPFVVKSSFQKVHYHPKFKYSTLKHLVKQDGIAYNTTYKYPNFNAILKSLLKC